ncbi:MAG: PPC domain-containing protein, partial [Pyrinomonadaceae bacterium]
MNAKRHFRARGTRGSVRVTLLALACLCALVAGLGRLGAQPSSAADAQGTKFPTVKRKAAQGETQQPQTAKPAKGAKTLAVVPASTSCPTKTPISPGQTLNGALAGTDCGLGDGSFYDEYTFTATAGQQLSVSMSSTDFDTYLFLLKPSETFPSQTTLQDDDGGGGTNSRIPATSGFVTVSETGTYSILANSFDANQTGAYSVTLTFGSGGGTICPPNPP